jgi:hypothetical protein
MMWHMDGPTRSPSTGPPSRDGGWLSRVWWIAVGALAGVGIAGMLTIGPPVIALAMLLAVIGVVLPRTRNRSAALAIAGLAAAPFLIAWLNRGGPGQDCRPIDGGTECVDAWSPWPFALVGVALVTLGVLASRRRGRPTDSGPDPTP